MVQNLCDYGTSMRAIDDDNGNERVKDPEVADEWEPFRDLIIKVKQRSSFHLIILVIDGTHFHPGLLEKK